MKIKKTKLKAIIAETIQTQKTGFNETRFKGELKSYITKITEPQSEALIKDIIYFGATTDLSAEEMETFLASYQAFVNGLEAIYRKRS